jgi:AcrR family transcriptional regulator
LTYPFSTLPSSLPPARPNWRARKPAAKAERRAKLLACAGALMAAHAYDYDALKMEDIASKAELAKGTAYLYFSSKEVLFLALLEEELGHCFAALKKLFSLAGQDDAPPPYIGDKDVEGEQIKAQAQCVQDHPHHPLADAIATTVTERPQLLALLGILHNRLERNLPLERLIAFKRFLLVGLMELAVILEACANLPQGYGLRLLLRTHGMIIGYGQMALPSPHLEALKAALPEFPMSALTINLKEELASSLTAMIVALQTPSPPPS